MRANYVFIGWRVCASIKQIFRWDRTNGAKIPRIQLNQDALCSDCAEFSLHSSDPIEKFALYLSKPASLASRNLRAKIPVKTEDLKISQQQAGQVLAFTVTE